MERAGRVVLTGVLLAGLAGAAAARGPGGGQGKAPSDKRAQNWNEEMGLSKEQARKLKEAFKSEREAIKPLQRELRDAMVKLEDGVDDEAADQDLQAALDRVDHAQKAVRAERDKFKESLSAILPLKARAKMALRMAHRPGPGGEGFGAGQAGREGIGGRHAFGKRLRGGEWVGGETMKGEGHHPEQGEEISPAPEAEPGQ